ncbi:hypothetical protein GCU60_19575 [Blastococcus saxobsidens]|uniref:Uncharacterized protein n=1 Tax=Blastococcus saxobsidens TaxID=138336 RepID=A0A6L9W785_9ACTN|nr:hypothetical protein [Blastococcus saxobsidens]NEK87943.1 hypothetical protein [Blastococcus saxobsidens]
MLVDLRVQDPMLTFWDAVVTTCVVMTDENDTRPRMDRLSDVLEGIFGSPESVDDIDPDLVEALNYMAENQEELLAYWTKHLRQTTAQDFLQRLFGAAVYVRLKRALQSDLQVLALAMRRLNHALLPYAVAIEDAAKVLTPEQLSALAVENFGAGKALDMLVSLDDWLQQAFQFDLPEELLTVPADEGPLTLKVIEESIDGIRQIVAGKSRRVLAELSDVCVRKMTGARTVLDVSEDGASQAANSLIELIDRLMRMAFTKTEVLAWIRANCADIPNLTYVKDGVELPTKRGEAMCFVHAGRPVEQRTPFTMLTGTAISVIRTQLQQIKHADTGTPEEVLATRTLMSALEGCFTLAFSFGWAGVEAAEVVKLKVQIEQAA